MDNAANPTLTYEHHVLICTHLRPDGRRSCSGAGAHELLSAAKRKLAKMSKPGILRANATGCLGRCDHGPVMVIYPANLWFSCRTPQQVEHILDQHLSRPDQ
ncbi:short chain dehydrogenase [Pseudomonas sp. FW300-N1A1]|uniref:(2Fe-2S) ferredoxin domain-containing protein n=1 Tax=Pseudomonas sp. FW300-N1A1 TaxID=2075555 RepID=UPI000CD19256|nr:(2Fe-2S) ferredoxin domain-containing protein [Pseudomonas sp. FW300-N1A1]POA17004.1 short chain dehydrogenase [Pseudomonas sp. FW300-N1A1]